MSKNTRVLLVEDSESDRFFFMESIKQLAGVTIYDIARNGQEALELLDGAKVLPDLIVTDINMPLMNGIELLAEMKKNPVMKDIPLVFLSSDTGRAEQARTLGAQGFITKPNDMNTLKDQLRKMMDTDLVNNKQMDFQTFQSEE